MTSATATEQRLYTDEFFQDPYPALADLRAQAPVHHSEREGCWMLTRHADAGRVLRDWETFSSVGRHARLLDPVPEPERGHMRAVAAQLTGDMINVDPPEHARMRSLVSSTFTPRALARLEPRVEAVAAGLLDALSAGEAGVDAVDLVPAYAYQLPALVVADLIGLPRERTAEFIAWADDWVDLLGSDPADGRVEAAHRADASLTAAAEVVAGLVDERRREPRDDVLTLLARHEGGTLETSEVLGNCMLLLLAGHETTTSVIATAVLTLLRHPRERAAALADPAVLRGAVEECMRLESPVQRARRVATRDVTIGPARVRAGESVSVLLGAANRDPDAFGEPDRFVPDRQPNRHLAFGLGVHFCIGAPLARLEAPIALARLFERFPGLALAADEPRWLPNRFTRRLERLPVTLA